MRVTNQTFNYQLSVMLKCLLMGKAGYGPKVIHVEILPLIILNARSLLHQMCPVLEGFPIIPRKVELKTYWAIGCH